MSRRSITSQESSSPQAVIAKDGSVANLTIISGPPLLRQAAIDAVKDWKCRPAILNGTPVEVLTQININFSHNGH